MTLSLFFFLVWQQYTSFHNSIHVICLSDIRRDGAGLLRDALRVLGSKGTSAAVFNSLPWERTEVIQTQDGAGPSRLGVFCHILWL